MNEPNPVYDANQRLQSATNPENGTVTYTYNQDGTVATKTDAKNQKIVYTYDSYKRVTEIQRFKSNGVEDVTQRTNYYYDSYDSYGQNLQGRLAAVTYTAGTWDSAGDELSFKEKYSYTPAGLPIGKHLEWTGTQSGFPTSVQPAVLEATFGYDDLGRRISLGHPSGDAPAFAYNSMGERGDSLICVIFCAP